MKKNTIVYRSNKLIPVTLKKMPEEMSHEELVSELVGRMMKEKTQGTDYAQRESLIHELETHQLELEIQNRELVEKYQDIEELNKKYVDLYDLAPVGYLSLDTKGNILNLNLTIAEMMKVEKKKVIGKNLGKWLHTEDTKRFYSHLSESLKSGEKIVCELDFITDNGENFLIELHSTSDEKVIHTAVIDVTERQKLKQAKEESNFLREERELREKFISTLSHDLRTPLSSSKLCAQMLSGAMDDLEKKKKLFDLMVEELDRADRMVRELLDASRIHGSEILPLLMKKSDLNAIAKKCIEHFESLSSGTVQINFRSAGDMTGTWSADGLQRVLENLLSNAAKYGAADLPATISLEDRGSDVLITVHNHGDPIPLKEQKRIFEAFHRGDSPRSSETIGWGLGLSLVNTIVKRHQGTITVKSSFEEGTSFIISLPKKTSDC